MSKPPKIEGAPGLTWRPCKDGWEARWRARHDLVKRGFVPKIIRLWRPANGQTEPKEIERAFIIDCCNRYQSEMLVWGRGGLPEAGTFDGTVSTLIRCYQTDPDSNYRKGRYATRNYYDTLCSMVKRDIGGKRVSEIRARDLLRWHEQYADRVAMGHSLIGMLRTLATFGTTLLDDDGCRSLKALLHDMRFKMPRSRTERLTVAQVIAIRAKAHELGFPMIALAQALQFELTVRQKDIIGEWVPVEEPGPLTAIVDGNEKWFRGLDWREVDQNWMLRHVTSKRQKEIVVNLAKAQMVVEELGEMRRDSFPNSGPIVTDKRTQLPYHTQRFRKTWRMIADAAGIPDSIHNMDTRSGAITEIIEAGASLEDARKTATHSDAGMTTKYSRGDEDAIARVMDLRVAARSKRTEN